MDIGLQMCSVATVARFARALGAVSDSFVEEIVENIFEEPSPDVEAPAQLFLACSVAAFRGQPSPQTMQFSGSLSGHAVNILVDSGSSHSFISESTTTLLTGQRPLAQPVAIRVANGNIIQCSAELPDVEWKVQDHSFHSTFKVLPLGSYDIILGMDWLEAFSPMNINWRCKLMCIPYGPGSVLLHGIGNNSDDCSLVQLFGISFVAESLPVPPILPQVQSLLDEFSELFAEPSALPPRRDCDHSIPLVPGAQPVCIRQYRYSPKLKSEIEAQ